jgi:hypothetical protein
MVAFLSTADEFKIWMEHVQILVTKFFSDRGIDFDFSSLPDQPYRDLYDDGIVPEAVADTLIDDYLHLMS